MSCEMSCVQGATLELRLGSYVGATPAIMLGAAFGSRSYEVVSAAAELIQPKYYI